MSAFQTINVSAGQDQKRQLLAKLMDQYQQNAGRAAALSGATGAVSATNSVASLGRGQGHFGTGLITGLLPNLGAALMARLGPGGIGHPIAGREGAVGSGLPVTMPFVANPHFGGNPAATAGPAVPIAPGPPANPGPPQQAAPAAASQSAAGVPLGNNLFFNTTTGQVVTGLPAARTGTAFAT